MSEQAAPYKSIRIKCGCPEPMKVEEKFGISMVGDVCPKCQVRMSVVNDPEPQEAPPAPPTAPEAPLPVGQTSDEKTMAMLCHLVGFFFGIVGAVILWVIKKDSSKFVDDQGKEAINFQISILIYMMISAVLCVILIGFLLLPVVGLLDIIFSIIAMVRANSGVAYRYPLTIRMIK